MLGYANLSCNWIKICITNWCDYIDTNGFMLAVNLMHVFPLLHFIVSDKIHNPLPVFSCATVKDFLCMYVWSHVCNSVTSDVTGNVPTVKLYYKPYFSWSSPLLQMKLLCTKDHTKIYVMVWGCDLWSDVIKYFLSALYYSSGLMDLDILLDNILFRDLFSYSGFCIHQ